MRLISLFLYFCLSLFLTFLFRYHLHCPFPLFIFPFRFLLSFRFLISNCFNTYFLLFFLLLSFFPPCSFNYLAPSYCHTFCPLFNSLSHLSLVSFFVCPFLSVTGFVPTTILLSFLFVHPFFAFRRHLLSLFSSIIPSVLFS